MSEENYKRATFIVEHDNTLDLRIEGTGPLVLNQHQYRMMSMAAREMMDGHAASCWQDHIPEIGYIRVVKRKYLCNNKCKRQGMQSVRTVNPEHNKRIPMIERPKLKISKRLEKFNFFNNLPSQRFRKKGV